MAETSDGPVVADGRMSVDDIIDDKVLDELLRRGAEEVTVKTYRDIESDLGWVTDDEIDKVQMQRGPKAPPKDPGIHTIDVASLLTQVCPVVAATAESEAEEFERLVPALKIQKTESLQKRLQKVDAPESTWQELEQAIRLQFQIVEAATFGLKDKFLPLLRAL